MDRDQGKMRGNPEERANASEERNRNELDAYRVEFGRVNLFIELVRCTHALHK